jgi:two-component system, OmpR family, response regulator
VRVLIVEDDPSMAASLRRGLEAEGYSVVVATDGDDGLWHAVEEDFDVMLLDLMLPKRSGYRVVADLRAAGRLTPVLVLTAKDGEWDQAEALDSGADDYLAKPFSYPVLLARLRALIRRAAGVADPVIAVADLRVDPSSRTCRRDDIPIELTSREFALLEYLALHAGTVVSKTELVEHVWDQAREPDTNVVEVYIGYLRRKIDAPFERPLLHTVRGAGYRLADDGA